MEGRKQMKAEIVYGITDSLKWKCHSKKDPMVLCVIDTNKSGFS